MQQLTLPPLPEGATYIGAQGNKTGDVYHLILLAGDNDPASHADQIEWAKSIGGELPTKLEYAMLFAHAPELFQKTAYWSSETFVDPNDLEDNAYAWFQNFDYGGQNGYRKYRQMRGRAVRRLFI